MFILEWDICSFQVLLEHRHAGHLTGKRPFSPPGGYAVPPVVYILFILRLHLSMNC
jgi:hypothetical protein